jgi:hypothetical protein
MGIQFLIPFLVPLALQASTLYMGPHISGTERVGFLKQDACRNLVVDSLLVIFPLSPFVVGRLYSVQYKSIFGAPDKVRSNTCDKARPLSQVLGVEPNTSPGYEVAEPPYHHQIIVGMQDCIPT